MENTDRWTIYFLSISIWAKNGCKYPFFLTWWYCEAYCPQKHSEVKPRPWLCINVMSESRQTSEPTTVLAFGASVLHAAHYTDCWIRTKYRRGEDWGSSSSHGICPSHLIFDDFSVSNGHNVALFLNVKYKCWSSVLIAVSTDLTSLNQQLLHQQDRILHTFWCYWLIWCYGNLFFLL